MKKTVLLIALFIGLAWGQDCTDGVEVELWDECYNIEETTNLSLVGDQLTGEIPSEIGNLTNLEILQLQYNQLTGEIPSEIGNLTNLILLSLYTNQLTGEIPSWIGNLTNLTHLELLNNQLSGLIPDNLCDVDNVYLTENKLCPPYPDCLNEEDIGYQDTSNCGQNNIEVVFQSDWNLVGLPLDVEDASYSNLFPESIGGTLYSYDGAYVPESYLTSGEGYWLRFNNAGSTAITGTTINELTISLNEGWNLVSGISETVSISSVSDPDGIIVSGTLYGYDGAYLPSEELMAGKGYWLRAYEDGEITLTSGALAKTAPRDFSLKGKANSLTVNGMNLYFGVEMSARERLSYSLPPKPPLGAFDIRFKGDTRIAGENTEIEVMNTYQTLTISYDVVLDAGEHMNWVLTSESGEEYIFEGTGEIIVPTEDTFTLGRKAIIPIAYTLHQNYPNPFNPITNLRYDLPEQAQVTLTVYNLMGREVTQLVNTNQEAGYRSVQWDATNMHGKPVSAGVYLYQIRAGEFVQTRKMVLLK